MRLLGNTKPPADPVRGDPTVRDRRVPDAPRLPEPERREAPEGMSARVLIAMARAARRPSAGA